MVALFAGLKWKLLTSRLRAAPRGKRIGAIVGLCALGLVAALIGFSLAMLRNTTGPTALVAATLFLTSQMVAWTLMPLIAFGVDETVDPQKFALLPLRRATLIRGLTVTGLIGWLPAMNAIVLIGLAVGLASTLAMLPITLICMAVQLLLCVGLSRASSTSLAALMSTRRGRDLGMVVGFGVFLLYMGINAGLSGISRDSNLASGARTASNVLGWTPAGALAQLPGLLHDGRVGAALLAVLIVVAAIGLVFWWWSAALRKSMESGPSVTSSSSPAGDHDFGGSTRGTAGVVAARDAVLVWRDPMRRLPWLMVIVFMVGFPFVMVQGHGTLFAVAFGALMSGTQVGNQFGVDGSGLWLHIVAIGDRAKAKAEIIGHLLVVIIPGTVLSVIAVVFCAVVRGDEQWIPAAIGVVLATMIGGAGVSSLMSASKPYAMPQSRGSMFASAVPAHKNRVLQVTLTILFGGLAVALPAIGLAALTILVANWWGWVGLIVGPGIAVVVDAVLIQKAAGVYFETAPEIFADVRLGDRV